MRVVIRAGNVPQIALRDQAARYRGCGTDEFFRGKAFEVIGIAVHIQSHAVHFHLLADVAGNEVGVITGFFEVIVSRLGRSVCEVQGFGDIRFYDFIVRVQCKKMVVEHFNVIPDLYRDVLPAVRGKGFKGFAIGQYVNMVPVIGRTLVAFPDGEATDRNAGGDEQVAEQLDVPECRVDVFELCEHDCKIDG